MGLENFIELHGNITVDKPPPFDINPGCHWELVRADQLCAWIHVGNRTGRVCVTRSGAPNIVIWRDGVFRGYEGERDPMSFPNRGYSNLILPELGGSQPSITGNNLAEYDFFDGSDFYGDSATHFYWSSQMERFSITRPIPLRPVIDNPSYDDKFSKPSYIMVGDSGWVFYSEYDLADHHAPSVITSKGREIWYNYERRLNRIGGPAFIDPSIGMYVYAMSGYIMTDQNSDFNLPMENYTYSITNNAITAEGVADVEDVNNRSLTWTSSHDEPQIFSGVSEPPSFSGPAILSDGTRVYIQAWRNYSGFHRRNGLPSLVVYRTDGAIPSGQVSVGCEWFDNGAFIQRGNLESSTLDGFW